MCSAPAQRLFRSSALLHFTKKPPASADSVLRNPGEKLVLFCFYFAFVWIQILFSSSHLTSCPHMIHLSHYHLSVFVPHDHHLIASSSPKDQATSWNAEMQTTPKTNRWLSKVTARPSRRLRLPTFFRWNVRERITLFACSRAVGLRLRWPRLLWWVPRGMHVNTQSFFSAAAAAPWFASPSVKDNGSDSVFASQVVSTFPIFVILFGSVHNVANLSKFLLTDQHLRTFRTMIQTASLSNNLEIPMIGLGTTHSGGYYHDAVLHAINKCGYRLIDTAKRYGVEKQLGIAVKNCSVPREDMFLCTKLWPVDCGKGVLDAFRTSCEKLQTDYLDLYMIHMPQLPDWIRNQKETREETWRQMELLYEAGEWVEIRESEQTNTLQVVVQNNRTSICWRYFFRLGSGNIFFLAHRYETHLTSDLVFQIMSVRLESAITLFPISKNCLILPASSLTPIKSNSIPGSTNKNSKSTVKIVEFCQWDTVHWPRESIWMTRHSARLLISTERRQRRYAWDGVSSRMCRLSPRVLIIDDWKRTRKFSISSCPKKIWANWIRCLPGVVRYEQLVIFD